MIKKEYNDGKEHVHVLSFGGGTQSTALLLMALKGEINGVKPDFVIFSDTGWEPKSIYKWIEKVNEHIKEKYDYEIIYTNGGNIRKDLVIAARDGKRMASLPYYTLTDVPVYENVYKGQREVVDENGEKRLEDLYEKGKLIRTEQKKGMVLRQCTAEYKIAPVKRKVRELLGYKPGQRVKEVVHMWKGISTDEIQRVKPIADSWIEAEHPLVDVVDMDRSACIAYVERDGLGTPAKSSCIGCPFHDDRTWLEMKRNDPESWEDACQMDELIRKMPKLESQCFLHKSCKPLREINLGDDQMDLFDDFTNECEGFCGI